MVYGYCFGYRAANIAPKSIAKCIYFNYKFIVM